VDEMNEPMQPELKKRSLVKLLGWALFIGIALFALVMFFKNKAYDNGMKVSSESIDVDGSPMLQSEYLLNDMRTGEEFIFETIRYDKILKINIAGKEHGIYYYNVNATMENDILFMISNTNPENLSVITDMIFLDDVTAEGKRFFVDGLYFGERNPIISIFRSNLHFDTRYDSIPDTYCHELYHSLVHKDNAIEEEEADKFGESLGCLNDIESIKRRFG